MEEKKKRTVQCGALNKKYDKKEVILNGWVHRIRNHGAFYFINLRDRWGVAQVVVESDAKENLKKIASELRNEFVVMVKGVVRLRPKDMKNDNMETGDVEVVAKEIEILNTCRPMPFQIEEETSANENTRLKYRFLDLRSFGMQQRLKLRHEVIKVAREFLYSKDFYEIETPTLIRSTPEGARDFLVPARLNPGKFYALPQSPQLYKQLLMVSGMEKYFQIARCYRDEDARGDRQLEFTQLDLEMSFVDREAILNLMEEMFGYIFKNVIGYKLPSKFTRLSYKEAMDNYGCDKPDLRFDLKMKDASKIIEKSSFDVYKNVLKEGGFSKYIVVPKKDGVDFSRKFTDMLTETAKVYGATGLGYLKYSKDTGFSGSLSKYFTDVKAVVKELGLKDGDMALFIVGGNWKKVCVQMGAVRTKLGEVMNLTDPNKFEFCWIVDFPLFAWNEEEGHWEAEHHMFSRPQERFIKTLEKNPGEVLGDLYDLVLNGYEVASGSIRIHDVELQKRIFRICNYSDEEAQKAFGFLLEAFSYGAPPHGGIAPGIDRICMIMAKKDSIKEVIAFPKNTFGISPMDDCPTVVDEKQLKDLHIKIDGITEK